MPRLETRYLNGQTIPRSSAKKYGSKDPDAIKQEIFLPHIVVINSASSLNYLDRNDIEEGWTWTGASRRLVTAKFRLLLSHCPNMFNNLVTRYCLSFSL